MSFRDSDQWFYAIRERNLDAIKANAERFAGTRGSHGETGLMLAAKLNIPEVVFFLAPREKGCYNHDGDTALKLAIDERNLACIDELLHYEIHLKTSKGSTPLHSAVRRNLLGYLSVLVKYWKNTPDTQGLNALDLAAQLGHDEAAEYLLKHGSFTHQEAEHASEIARGANHYVLANTILSVAAFCDRSIVESRRAMVSHHQSSRSIGRLVTEESTHPSSPPLSIFDHSRSSRRSYSDKTNTDAPTSTPEIYAFNCPRCRTMFESMAKRLKDMTAECHRLKEELSRRRTSDKGSSSTSTLVEKTPDPKPIGLKTALAETVSPVRAPQMPFLSFDTDNTAQGEPSGSSFSIAIGHDNPQSSILVPPTTTHDLDRKNISGRAASTNHSLRSIRGRGSSLHNVEQNNPLHTPEYYSAMKQSPSYLQRIAALRSQASATPPQAPERAVSHNLNRKVSPLTQNNSTYNISSLRPSSYEITSH
ncbi:Protein 21.1 [Giardia lamblia P15]|uniref:Protein 21.1 n=1 Tax=Giardia intestinalis (strain P15) TaxID=658858 RepID=E1F6I7_GIAIA|nr:Protein 21.1 [Giardia lamblia P15]